MVGGLFHGFGGGVVRPFLEFDASEWSVLAGREGS